MPGDYGFYSTSFQHKQAAIFNLPSTHADLVALLDDICDGCGGCERMSYSGPDGNDLWVSVFAEEGDRVHYIVLEVKPSDDGTHEIVDAIEMSRPRWITGDDSQDSPSVYAAVLSEVIGSWDEVLGARRRLADDFARDERAAAVAEARASERAIGLY